ncbi:unnamed protein product [Meloidogyne enterolobii]|uniref:Uncharacterized protein n=1 Tax=Meloidogyne enterolobii TaxID=390850 RepID=A0ACB0ZJA6_MELEN
MNIQIGFIMETTELICNQNVFLEFEALASLRSEEKSEINFSKLEELTGMRRLFFTFLAYFIRLPVPNYFFYISFSLG